MATRSGTGAHLTVLALMRAKIVLVAAAFALLVPATASAHGPQALGRPQTFVQSIGPYELAVTMQVPNALPSPLSVEVAPDQPVEGTVSIALWVVRVGQPLTGPPTSQVISGSRSLVAQFPISDPGNYELAVVVSGQNGGGEARVPLTVAPQPVSWLVVVMLFAAGTFVLIVIGALALQLILYRRRLPVRAHTRAWLTPAMASCAAVALIAFIATQLVPANAATASAASAASTVASSRAFVNVRLSTSSPTASDGEPTQLQLEVTDGGTGLPVDDLVPDDEALMHLVIVSADRAFFQHLYPARTAPGRYVATFTPDRQGEYTAFVEVIRQGSGTQLVARQFSANGSGPAARSDPGSIAPTIEDVSVSLETSPGEFPAGELVDLSFTFTASGRTIPIAPYHGLKGDLVVTSTDGTLFGHVHALDPGINNSSLGVFSIPSTGAPPTQTPPVLSVRFAYTFPAPGHYTVWTTVKRADTGEVLTVPQSLDVT